MRESTGTVVRARAPPLVPAPVPAPAPVPLSIPLCVPPALQSVAVSMPVCAPASSPRLDPWSVRVPVSVSISFCVLLPPSPAAHSVSVSIPVWAPASTPCLDLNPRSAGAPVSVLISFCVPAVPVSVAVSMPVVCAPRLHGQRGLLRRVCILLVGQRESRQLDHNGLALACKFELDNGACRADDVLLDDFALDANAIVVAGPHQPIAHAHLARQVDGPAPLDVAHNTATTRLLGGLLQRHAHTTGRPRPIVGTCGRCIISSPRVQIGPVPAPVRRALPRLAEVSCIPLAVAHVPGSWSLEPPGLASIARSPTIPHIAPLHPLAFIPPVMSAPHVAAIRSTRQLQY